MDEDGLEPEDLLLPRPDRADGVRAASAGARGRRCCISGSGTPGADLESYVAIHQGVIFGALTLVTGSIWAKYPLGPLVGLERAAARALPRAVPLLLRRTSCSATRSSPGPQRANLCAVYALFGVVLIPVSFLAIRLAENVHPPGRLQPRTGRRWPARSSSRSASSLAAMLALAARSTASSSPGKRLDAAPARAAGGCSRDDRGEVRRGRRTCVVLRRSCSLYVVIIALKLSAARARGRRARRSWRGARGERSGWLSSSSGPPARLRRGGARLRRRRAARARPAALATWGVRIGWLAQTALLDRAGRARGRVPVGDVGRLARTSSSGSSSASYLDLGLPAALPAARPRGDAARRRRCSSSRGSAAAPASAAKRATRTSFLVLHVGLVLRRLRGLHARGRAVRALPRGRSGG